MGDIKDILTSREIGQAIRAERRRQKRTQAWLAEHAKTARQTVVDIEAGGNVSLYTLSRILLALGLLIRLEPRQIDYTRLREVFEDEDQ